METIAFKKDNFLITTDPALLQVKIIHNYLANESYWAQDRPMAVVEKSLRNSLCFGVYTHNKQIGLARVVTDYAVFAYIMDLFIVKDYQGRGLGKWLMSCIMSHPDLQDVTVWALRTRDAHGLYEKYDFTKITNPESWMTLVKRNL
ncbi:MAG TPA: GNAT family N-acetyltransferase [bacterium]|nr:GNAT family N-acetyltransferase [bacterium]HPN44796.1 GNAT family N-acetyltransferase [bacterium]